MDTKVLFDAALALVATHNEAFSGASDPGFVEGDRFISKIKVMGGTSPDRLKSLSYEEILKALPTFDGIQPVALAKDIASTWRGMAKGVEEPNSPKRPVSGKKADRLTLEELVNAFDPEDTGNAVGQRLLKESKGQPFLVYSSGRDVDVTRSFALLKELKKGYEARAHFEGKPVYAIGVLPDNYADENPLYPGRPLRPDDTCDQLNRSWAGVPQEVRQFVNFALKKKNGIVNLDRDKAHAVLDMALSTDALQKFRQRYPEVAIEFDTASRTGKLPNLLIPLGQPVTTQKESDNPFLVGSR